MIILVTQITVEGEEERRNCEEKDCGALDKQRMGSWERPQSGRPHMQSNIVWRFHGAWCGGTGMTVKVAGERSQKIFLGGDASTRAVL